MTKRLKYMYVFSLLPLVIGTLLFLYWFYRRVYFASDAHIEIAGFFTLMGYLVFAVITIVLSVIFIVKDRTAWKKTLIPLAALGVTLISIQIYATVYDFYSEKAFVRLINNTPTYKIERLWSAHFEQQFHEPSKEEIVSFYPVYTYDYFQIYGTMEYSFPYTIDSVYLNLRDRQQQLITCRFPRLSKGDCETIYVSDLIKDQVILKRRR